MAKKVCLDAGHYGKYNRSPAIKSYYESEMNWKLHNLLKKYLEQYGIEVVLTRNDQAKDLELEARGKKAAGCNLFLSIHSNAVGSYVNESIDYPVVYVPLNGTGDAIGKKLADCMASLMETKQPGRISSRKGNRGDYYGVIRGAVSVGVPGLILEHSFHTNTRSTEWLMVESNLEKMAKAEAAIIAEYLGANTPTHSVPLTYEVVVDLPTYSSSDDAKAKKNVKGKYAPGTYYIYTKYPTGVNGMLNISSSQSGMVAGAWINPDENVKPQTDTVQKFYRVRKSWADEKSQKGAFVELKNAKNCCQDAGEGYKVFDWNGQIVYSSVEHKDEEKVVEVYNLNYPEKNQIVELGKQYEEALLKRDCTKAIKNILDNNANFDVNIAKVFFELAPKYNIDPMMAISQSVLETGWFKYENSAVKTDQHNYCGMGVISNGLTGNSFDTIEDGVRAQLQHLYAYGCKDVLPEGETTIVDPRFKYVTRGVAPYWQNLAGRWACPGYDKSKYATPEDAMKAGNTYGQKIRAICVRLNDTDVSQEDIEKYFPVEEPIVHDTPTVQENPVAPTTPEVDVVEEKKIDVTKANFVISLLEKIFKAIIQIFSKK